MTNEELNKMRELLPHGAQKKIAVMAKVTPYVVNMVLHGKSENLDVINETVKFIRDYNRKKTRAFESVKQVVYA